MDTRRRQTFRLFPFNHLKSDTSKNKLHGLPQSVQGLGLALQHSPQWHTPIHECSKSKHSSDLHSVYIVTTINDKPGITQSSSSHSDFHLSRFPRLLGLAPSFSFFFFSFFSAFGALGTLSFRSSAAIVTEKSDRATKHAASNNLEFCLDNTATRGEP